MSFRVYNTVYVKAKLGIAPFRAVPGITYRSMRIEKGNVVGPRVMFCGTDSDKKTHWYPKLGRRSPRVGGRLALRLLAKSVVLW